MDKRTFFDNLNKQLAEKYDITISQVNTIRSFYLGKKKSRKEIAEWLAIKIHQPNKHSKLIKSKSLKRTHSQQHYQTLLNFVASCSEDIWNNITQKTEFDI